jgi:hypothetical protein
MAWKFHGIDVFLCVSVDTGAVCSMKLWLTYGVDGVRTKDAPHWADSNKVETPVTWGVRPDIGLAVAARHS